MSTWRLRSRSSMLRQRITGSPNAEATCCTRWVKQRSSFAGGIVLRTGKNGRTGELGVFEGFVGTILEPDVAVDDRVAIDDVAAVGGAVSDHPKQSVGETGGRG